MRDKKKPIKAEDMMEIHFKASMQLPTSVFKKIKESTELRKYVLEHTAPEAIYEIDLTVYMKKEDKEGVPA